MSTRAIVIYDPDCGMCEAAMRFVRRCDWLHRLEIADYYTAAERYPEVAARELDDGMQVRFANGTTTVAEDAVRSTMMRTIPGALVGWLLYVPGIHWLSGVVYRQVAMRRTRSCAVPGATPDA